jgi:hypothetical protein
LFLQQRAVAVIIVPSPDSVSNPAAESAAMVELNKLTLRLDSTAIMLMRTTSIE